MKNNRFKLIIIIIIIMVLPKVMYPQLSNEAIDYYFNSLQTAITLFLFFRDENIMTVGCHHLNMCR
ncbi:hypothetical protein M2475_001846 [Breznakia sp. PF5-3]|nr:hypothetical protein [Breznakia sp. PM6-1]MDF9836269.1 hypothetical protein [Breznakia sp. PF5-3]MDF9837579.1 hypothetical protein [Breznakia sp. PFB2-8]MDF9860192.1 hypothetical protein [Breznakia sp. PH5-24]